MPQMAPLNWMLILILTSMIITMINCINYSNYQKPSTLTNKLNKPQIKKILKMMTNLFSTFDPATIMNTSLIKNNHHHSNNLHKILTYSFPNHIHMKYTKKIYM